MNKSSTKIDSMIEINVKAKKIKITSKINFHNKSNFKINTEKIIGEIRRLRD